MSSTPITRKIKSVLKQTKSVREAYDKYVESPEGKNFDVKSGTHGEWDNKYNSKEEFIGSFRGDDVKGIAEYEGANTPDERAKIYKSLREDNATGWQREEGVVTDYDTAYKDRNMDVYGNMTKPEYIQEAKKQKQSFIDTGSFNAPSKKAGPFKMKGFSGFNN